MPVILAVLFFCGIIALCFGPALWTKRILRRNAWDRDDFPGTGGELASHLLENLNLDNVRVEETLDGQDHYDPTDKAVRLGPSNMHGRSLTAVVSFDTPVTVRADISAQGVISDSGAYNTDGLRLSGLVSAEEIRGVWSDNSCSGQFVLTRSTSR